MDESEMTMAEIVQLSRRYALYQMLLVFGISVAVVALVMWASS